MPKFRTKTQNSKMFGLASKAGVSHDDLRDWTSEITSGRTDHTSKLYQHEAQEIINRLEKFVNPNGTPRRTENYRRQKAGVKTIVSQAHLAKLQHLADGRSMTSEGLAKLCVRIFGAEKPRTSHECSKAIEAIKDMNKRDRVFAGSFKKEAA
jgi:hypothetical protein